MSERTFCDICRVEIQSGPGPWLKARVEVWAQDFQAPDARELTRNLDICEGCTPDFKKNLLPVISPKS